jgi:hypothetical protein
LSLFKATALEPWPVEDPGAVVKVWARSGGRPVGPSIDEYRFMREHVKSFTGLVAHAPIYPARLRAGGVAEISLRASWGSANVFDVLGVTMQLGSGFVAEDDAAGTGERRWCWLTTPGAITLEPIRRSLDAPCSFRTSPSPSSVFWIRSSNRRRGSRHIPDGSSEDRTGDLHAGAKRDVRDA